MGCGDMDTDAVEDAAPFGACPFPRPLRLPRELIAEGMAALSASHFSASGNEERRSNRCTNVKTSPSVPHTSQRKTCLVGLMRREGRLSSWKQQRTLSSPPTAFRMLAQKIGDHALDRIRRPDGLFVQLAGITHQLGVSATVRVRLEQTRTDRLELGTRPCNAGGLAGHGLAARGSRRSARRRLEALSVCYVCHWRSRPTRRFKPTPGASVPLASGRPRSWGGCLTAISCLSLPH